MQLVTAQEQLHMYQARTAQVGQEQAETTANLGGDPALPIEQNPSVLTAQSALEQAQLDLERTVVLAPANGVVGNKVPVPGDVVSPGQPLFSLVLTDRFWVDANLKETDLTHVRPGQSALVTIDTYPGVRWKARVDSISPASGAEFSLLPPQNATGNWVKVVQRIPVRLALEPEADQPPLRAGMSAEVEIDIEAAPPAEAVSLQ